MALQYISEKYVHICLSNYFYDFSFCFSFTLKIFKKKKKIVQRIDLYIKSLFRLTQVKVGLICLLIKNISSIARTLQNFNLSTVDA